MNSAAEASTPSTVTQAVAGWPPVGSGAAFVGREEARVNDYSVSGRGPRAEDPVTGRPSKRPQQASSPVKGIRAKRAQDLASAEGVPTEDLDEKVSFLCAQHDRSHLQWKDLYGVVESHADSTNDLFDKDMAMGDVVHFEIDKTNDRLRRAEHSSREEIGRFQ